MKEKTKSRFPGLIVLTCAMIVIAWQLAGIMAQRKGDDFSLQADDFDSFELKLDGWQVRQLEIMPTSMEVNLLGYRLTPVKDFSLTEGTKNTKVLVRLVHGYNMRDCMRIKGYEVVELTTENTKNTEEVSGQEVQGSESLRSLRSLRETSSSPSPQLWRLTSGSGDASLWLSEILRAGDFSPTGESVTDMPFPRVGVPTDPNWMPKGLTLRSFRHPIRNLKFTMNAKWNGSRCDLLTFLGLRKPAWASEDSLTFLVVWVGQPLQSEDEAAVAALLGDLRSQILPQLQEWGAKRGM